jgi:hypothetical protein
MADYPDTPGFYAGAPETSRHAAASVTDAAKNREALALRLITAMGGYGATADEVADRLGWDERYSSRPRLSTLHADGKIIDSGKRRRGVSGRMQAVWILPQFKINNGENAHVDAARQAEAVGLTDALLARARKNGGKA